MTKILSNQFHMYRIPQAHDCGGDEGCQECTTCTHHNLKKKKPARPPSPDELKSIAENALAQWSEFDEKDRRLLEVKTDHIVYQEGGKTLKRSFNYNQYGALEFGLASEVSNYQQLIIQQTERRYSMEDNLLLPSGVVTDEEEEQIQIQTLCAEADAAGLLLPMEIRALATKPVKQQDQGHNLLLPIGVEGR